MKKNFIILLLLACLKSHAYDIAVGNFFYNVLSLSEKTVEVTYGESTTEIVSPYKDMKSVDIPATISIYSGKYQGAYKVVSIGNYAFRYCKQLTEVNLPEGLKKIDGNAFVGCTNLTNISFPSTLESLAGFRKTGLMSIVVPKSVKYIGNFDDCTHLASVTFEEGSQLETIGSDCFTGDNSLTKLIIPEGVSSIGTAAFYDCTALQYLELPKNITTLGVLSTCKALRTIRIRAFTPPTIKSNYFPTDAYLNGKLYIPRGTWEMYKDSEGWKEFQSITELSELGTFTGEKEESDFSDRFVVRYNHTSDNEMFQVTVRPGDDYQCIITPPYGWKIHTLTLNDKDVTSDLKADMTSGTEINYYSLVIRNLSEDIFLNAAFEEITSNINQTRTNKLKVYSTGSGLRIIGTEYNAHITIYNTEGKKLHSTIAQSSDIRIPLERGIYIIKTGERTIKICI